jgi:GntR family transcriptional regulator
VGDDLDHDSVTPLYVQLAAILRGKIERGEVTGRLPSVKGLQQEYGVAQGTAERAFAILREEGLVTSGQGRGHFVIPPEQRAPRRP